MHSSEEIYWIERIKAGESDYFAKLYRRHNEKLFALCIQFTRNQADAEEQLQEIFLRIIENIGSFQEKSSFSTWITRISLNHLSNFSSRQKERFEELSVSVESQAALDSSDDPELSISLGKAIQQLPDGFRTVFILHEQLGYKHNEIGQILGIQPSTSRSQLTRARLLLREKLKVDYDKVAP